MNKFPSNKRRQTRPDEDQMSKTVFKAKDEGNEKEIRREDRQVKRISKLKKLESKDKTETNRYKKLKEKVYNPFPEKTLSRRDEIKDFKKGYMDRKTKYTGLPLERPVRPGENKSEYNNEKGEFYYNKINKKVSMLPTDYADRPITKGVKKRNLGKNFK